MEDLKLEEIKEWVHDTMHTKPRSDEPFSIFKVPHMLLAVQRKAFYPEIFFFGRFYDKRPGTYMNLMTRHLPGLFGDINESPSQSRNKVGLDDKAYKDMIELVVKANECYDKNSRSKLEGRAIFELMVVDGCFIVERLRSFNKSLTDDDEKKQPHARGSSRGSHIFDARWQLPSLQRDLIKLQNQLPLFFLEKIYSMTTSGNDEPSLRDIILTFFCSMLSLDESIYNLEPNGDYAHPLDLIRSSIIFSRKKKKERNEVHKIFIDKLKSLCWPKKNEETKEEIIDDKKERNEVQKIFIDKLKLICCPKKKEKTKEKRKLIYSAQDLQEAGVALKRKEKSTLLDISFDSNKRVLQIPLLSIDENMTVALLNFVAYEQCDHKEKPYFTNYLLFLDSLINTTRDVEILRENRIICYTLGREKEVVDFFNNFCKGMLYSFDQSSLTVDMDAINSYCKAFYDSKWRFWWSNLKRERFSSPWTFLSLAAAIVLLTLTMLQTFFAIFPYYHRN